MTGFCFDNHILSVVQLDACFRQYTILLCAVEHNGVFCVIVSQVLILPMRQAISYLGPARIFVLRLISRPNVLNIIHL